MAVGNSSEAPDHDEDDLRYDQQEVPFWPSSLTICIHNSSTFVSDDRLSNPSGSQHSFSSLIWTFCLLGLNYKYSSIDQFTN